MCRCEWFMFWQAHVDVSFMSILLNKKELILNATNQPGSITSVFLGNVEARENCNVNKKKDDSFPSPKRIILAQCAGKTLSSDS